MNFEEEKNLEGSLLTVELLWRLFWKQLFEPGGFSKQLVLFSRLCPMNKLYTLMFKSPCPLALQRYIMKDRTICVSKELLVTNVYLFKYGCFSNTPTLLIIN